VEHQILSPTRFGLRSIIAVLSATVVMAALSASMATESRGEEIAGVKKYNPLPVSGEIAQGGYVLILEQVAGEGNEGGVDCTGSNTLTDDQRLLAGSIGEAFKRHGIPVGRILASSRCAARETAESLNLGDVVADATLDPVSVNTTDPEEVRRLRRMLAVELPEGGNVLLVSHGANVARLLKSTVSNPPGTLHAFRLTDGAVAYTGSLKPAEWVEMK
jgi:phosphohistidine phosphatase SixA